MMDLKILELTSHSRQKWESPIAAMEEGITYPLGEDRFSIDHGSNYFAFFDRMGDCATYVALSQQRVAAVGAVVQRSLRPHQQADAMTAWYLCDLKVHREFRRRRIPLRMFVHGFPRKYAQCPRGYAITMNPSDGSENPVTRLAGHVKLVPVSTGPTLVFYSLTQSEMESMRPTIEFHRGPTTFLSMTGTKNIVLQSTGKPMPLLHLQFGPCAQLGFTAPQPDHVHMFCCPADDPLAEAMLSHGFTATATATVLHHRMSEWDWSFVLTNEI